MHTPSWTEGRWKRPRGKIRALIQQGFFRAKIRAKRHHFAAAFFKAPRVKNSDLRLANKSLESMMLIGGDRVVVFGIDDERKGFCIAFDTKSRSK
jgi:hypothetical protein